MIQDTTTLRVYVACEINERRKCVAYSREFCLPIRAIFGFRDDARATIMRAPGRSQQDVCVVVVNNDERREILTKITRASKSRFADDHYYYTTKNRGTNEML